MADERPSFTSPGSQQDAPLVVNLQIVSPSVGVGNLRFPGIPATTTVQQLRERIRESVSSQPTDDQQRLIHRGRLLARGADTLQDVFGEEAIRANEQQTIHLVLRDAGDRPPPNDPLARAPRPTPAGHPLRPGSVPIATPHVTAHLPQHVQQHHHHHQHLHQSHHELMRQEAILRAMEDDLQSTRAPQGLQNSAVGAQRNAADPTGGRSSPVGQAFRTVTREGTGPDGQRYSFRITVNETIAPPGSIPHPPRAPGSTTDPVGRRPLSAAEIRDLVHGADASQAAQIMARAMHRNVLGGHPADMAAERAQFNFNSPIQPIQPGVTTPIFPGLSRNTSRAATPDISARSASYGSGIGPSSEQPQPRHGQPEVYILSSPTGPRGLLINSTSEVYTTAARPLAAMPNLYRPLVPPSLFADTHRTEAQFQHGQAAPHLPPHTQPYQPPAPPAIQQQPLPQSRHEQLPAIRRRPVPAAAAPAAPAAPAAEQPVPHFGHPGNPGVAPLMAAAWPHVWLLIRLVAFAWWFSYTDPSWERWLSLVLAFVVVLAINTGIFNGMVNNAFHPVREQLEGMIPFADPDRQQQDQHQQGRGQQNRGLQDAGRRDGAAAAEPDPAQTAARLVAQRRIQNGGWLRDQLRRIERAGILFIASFAPGVAERHIQQQEERERAERRAAEEARAAAAAAAAAAQQQAEQAAAAENQEGQEGQGDGAAEQQHVQAPQVQPQPPLVEV